ncbi:hypothetical protein PP505_gp29 [Gordonia phage Dorito]|uniref:Uncharacterized protein n=1 Tax=Gordonia phage Dorito TaxID=2499023 RepID=A0A3S9UAH7_9CAUD|nr:hypothetical protein PP505_gp29 [Gordonia phage Dorito]AZS07299.1 hypothetical protein PBI_DORITO_29 [Gordonia phage Dorito]
MSDDGRKLRLLHVAIQPVVVWDDGTELSAGPDLSPVVVPLSQAADILAALPAEVRNLAAQIAEQSGDEQGFRVPGQSD